MTRNPDDIPAGKGPLRPAQVREARLKAALKANMAKRKAQARGRNTDVGGAESQTETKPGQTDGAEQE